jgi:uncharacterized RDD family membrane protein YckC
MGQQWYYTQGGAQTGPVTTDVLRQMFAAGQLGPDELIWADGMPDWQRARDVPTFFAPTPPQPQQQPYYNPQQPYAGQPGAYPSPYGAAPAPINDYTPQTYVQYAGFWLRFCALFIDYVIIWIGTFVISFVIGFAVASGGGRVDADGSVTGVLQLFSIVVVWLYFALQESSAAQATLGKRALGLKVTDGYGNRISFGRATGRHFGKIISGLILAIGYIMAAFTEKKQALHDIMADTLVIRQSQR